MFLQPRLLTHSASESPNDSAEAGAKALESGRMAAYPTQKRMQKRILRPAKIWGQTITVIPRQDCSFRRIDLKGRGQSATQAAYFKARREALEDEDSFKIIPDRSGARSGAWSGERAGLWGFKNPNPTRSRCLPETLAREGFDTGCRLVKTLSGFEGQVWQDSNLIGSRWWRSLPSQQKWVGFLRACESETNFEFDLTAVPRPEEIGFRENLPPIEFDRDYLSTVFSPMNLAGFAATVLMCGFVFVSAQYVQSTLALKSIEKKISDTSDDTNKILSQRRRALGNMVAAKRYFELGHEGEFLLGLSTLSKPLSEKGLKILIASYSDKTIKLQLVGETDIPVSELVKTLEAREVLQNVNIAIPSSGRLTVSSDIVDLYTIQTAKPVIDTKTKTEDDVPW